MEKIEDMDNQMKWSAIPLLIGKYFDKRLPRDILNAQVFERPVEGAHKFDGTNVGKDQDGMMYGRNKMINPNSASYQKTPLGALKGIDVAAVKKEIEGLIGVEDVGNFVLYGELMCNKGLYDYDDKQLPGAWTIFGAMIQPKEDAQGVVEAFQNAHFTVALRGAEPGEEEENPNHKIMLTMNTTFKALMDKFGHPTVPFIGRFENLYELVKQNKEWMVKGMGEGIVITHCAFSEESKTSSISKWKNGSEENSVNAGFIESVLQDLEEDKENKIFGENTEKAIEMLNDLLDVQKSRLIMGKIPEPWKPKQKEAKAQKAPKVQPGSTFTPEEVSEYEAAVKSAKSKFDHEDTYFARGMKGVKEFSGLIAKECLSDITPKDEQEHPAYIEMIIKQDFIAYNKAKSQKK